MTKKLVATVATLAVVLTLGSVATAACPHRSYTYVYPAPRQLIHEVAQRPLAAISIVETTTAPAAPAAPAIETVRPIPEVIAGSTISLKQSFLGPTPGSVSLVVQSVSISCKILDWKVDGPKGFVRFVLPEVNVTSGQQCLVRITRVDGVLVREFPLILIDDEDAPRVESNPIP